MGKLSKAEEAELAQLEAEEGLSADEEKELQALEAEFGGNKTSATQTGIEQFAKGVPVVGSYLPQLQAAAEKPIFGLLNKLTGNNVEADDYLTSRDQNIARHKLQEEEHPYLSTGAQLAGGVASAGALPGINAATRLGRVGQAAKVGTGIGLLSNPGDVKGEMSGLQIGDRAFNAALGTATGVAGQGLLETPGALKDKLRSSAETSAFKAFGPYAREARQAMSNDKVNEIGRTALDEGVIKGIPRDYGILEERAKAKSGQVGKELGDYIEALSKDADKLNLGVNKKDIALDASEKLINPQTGIPSVPPRNQKVMDYLAEFAPGDSPNKISLSENEALKRGLGKEIKWDRLPGADIPLEEEINRALYSKSKSASEDLAQKVEDRVFGEGSGIFKGLKSTYGNLETMADIASKRDAKELANRIISPSDYMTGIGGSIAGVAAGDSPEDKIKYGLLGLGAGGVNKLSRQYGNQLSAVLKDTASKGFGKIDNSTIMGLLKENPRILQGLLTQAYSQ